MCRQIKARNVDGPYIQKLITEHCNEHYNGTADQVANGAAQLVEKLARKPEGYKINGDVHLCCDDMHVLLDIGVANLDGNGRLMLNPQYLC